MKNRLMRDKVDSLSEGVLCVFRLDESLEGTRNAGITCKGLFGCG